MKTLINEEYLKEYSLFPSNYDMKEVKNFIPIAEQIHIQPILGTPLYEELLEQVTTNTLTDANSTLLLEVYKVLGLAVVYEALPFVWAHITAVGITKGKSDNSDSVENKDMAYLNTHIKSQLEYTKTQLKKWLDDYSNNFPLYIKEDTVITNRQMEVYPLKKELIDLL